jgi:hypothetical protein
MPPAGFKLTISAGEWPLTYALGCASTGIGIKTDHNKTDGRKSKQTEWAEHVAHA